MAFGYFAPRNLRVIARHPLLVLESWLLGQDNLIKRLHVAETFRHIDPQPQDELLEIGASALYYAGELARRVRRCVAVDHFEGFERQLSERRFPRSLEAVRADAHTLPFRDATFDKVFASELFPVLQDPARCVAEIFRVLRPGGRVVTVHGNVFAEMEKLMNEAEGRQLVQAAHARWGTPTDYASFSSLYFATHGTNRDFFRDRNGTVQGLLRQAGFQIVACSWSMGRAAQKYYCMLLLRALVATGRPVLGRGQVLHLPYLKLLERRDPAGEDGLTLLCSARKP